MTLKDKHYPGLPVWMKIPEHASLNSDELILTTYKIATQIHSRSQNCKYLTEITHHEPAWINSDTASALRIADGDTVKLTRSKTLYNDKAVTESLRMGTIQTSMEVEVRPIFQNRLINGIAGSKALRYHLKILLGLEHFKPYLWKKLC